MNARKAPPQRIDSLLEEVLSEKGYLTVCKEFGILNKWPAIVGEKIARVTNCERVENGIVYVKVASAPWRQEIAYCKELLLKRIKTEFNCPTIQDIIFY